MFNNNRLYLLCLPNIQKDLRDKCNILYFNKNMILYNYSIHKYLKKREIDYKINCQLVLILNIRYYKMYIYIFKPINVKNTKHNISLIYLNNKYAIGYYYNYLELL